MSQKATRAFIEKMKTDEVFRTKVMAIEDVAARARFINTEGFECSPEELKGMMTELTEGELAAAAGGRSGAGCRSRY